MPELLWRCCQESEPKWEVCSHRRCVIPVFGWHATPALALPPHDQLMRCCAGKRPCCSDSGIGVGTGKRPGTAALTKRRLHRKIPLHPILVRLPNLSVFVDSSADVAFQECWGPNGLHDGLQEVRHKVVTTSTYSLQVWAHPIMTLRGPSIRCSVTREPSCVVTRACETPQISMHRRELQVLRRATGSFWR